MRHRPVLGGPLLLVLALHCATAASAQPKASFQGLGSMGGDHPFSRPHAVSADGSTIVSEATAGDQIQGFRWRRPGGMEPIGCFQKPASGRSARETISRAFAVSDDGEVVVGDARDGEAMVSFRWTKAGGLTALGPPPGAGRMNRAESVSADGSVILGDFDADGKGYGCFPSRYEPFIWTQAAGMKPLLEGPDAALGSYSTDLSGDGTVAVGVNWSGKGMFRWTKGQGVEWLSKKLHGQSTLSPQALSRDGRLIGGVADHGDWQEGFVWDGAAPPVWIGDLPGGDVFSWVGGLSSDGSRVVGKSSTSKSGYRLNDIEAYLWDQEHGIRRVADVLKDDFGIATSGWKLEEAIGISVDGTVIVGEGRNPSGNTEGWVAVIPLKAAAPGK